MSDTLTNIDLVAGEWTDLYAATGIDVGTVIQVENIGVCDVYLAVQAVKPNKDHDAYNVVKREGPPLQNSEGDAGAWALCNNTGGKVNVNPQITKGFFPIPGSPAVKIGDESGRVAMVSMTGEEHVAYKVDDISVNFQYGISDFDIVSDGADVGTETGTGIIGTDGSLAVVGTGTGIGTAYIESKDSVRYRAGHECHGALSVILGTPESGVNQYAGFLNGDDGWCVGYQGLNFGIWFIEGSNVNFILQDDFNIDKLDGTGPSGYNINPQTGQLYRLTYTWHGFLDMVLEIRTDDGRWMPAHRSVFVNSALETHLENPNLPISIKVERLAGSGANIEVKTGSWRGGVMAGVEENNTSDRWFPFFKLDQSVSASPSTASHLLSLRSKEIFQSKVNHIKTLVKIIRAASTFNKDLIIAVYPTVILRAADPIFAAAIDADYVDVNTQNSVMEIAKGVDTVDISTLDESDIADLALIQSNRSTENLDVTGFNIFPQDEVSFVAIPQAGGSGTVSIQGNFKELH